VKDIMVIMTSTKGIYSKLWGVTGGVRQKFLVPEFFPYVCPSVHTFGENSEFSEIIFSILIIAEGVGWNSTGD